MFIEGKTMDYIENTPLGNSESTKNKLGRFKRAIKPWNDYIKYRKEVRELRKIEKRNKKIKRLLTDKNQCQKKKSFLFENFEKNYLCYKKDFKI